MRALRVVAALAVVGTAAWFAAGDSWPWRRLGRPSATAVADTAPRYVEVMDTLRRGETIGIVLARHGIGDLDIARVLPALDPRRLRAGLALRFRKPQHTEPATELRVRTDGRRYTVRRIANGWSSSEQPVLWQGAPVRVSGTITSTLFDALVEAVGEDVFDAENRAALAYALADVFAWQLDFSRDIQVGDRFSVVVERETSDDGDVRVGRILAGDLVASGRRLTAFAYAPAGGRVSFYDAEGRSLRRAFLAAPVELRRISSGFSRARFHPVLGRFRAHQGIDYAASTGTPVMAAGDGTVLRAGWSGGYGNLIELRHANGVTTRYGHLQRIAKGIRPGARVGQGQTIGYVGSTGMSTGPHLHFEFRDNGEHRDPAVIARQSEAIQLPVALRPQFEAVAQARRLQLDAAASLQQASAE